MAQILYILTETSEMYIVKYIYKLINLSSVTCILGSEVGFESEDLGQCGDLDLDILALGTSRGYISPGCTSSGYISPLISHRLNS